MDKPRDLGLFKKILIVLAIAIVAILAITGFNVYRKIYVSNVILNKNSDCFIYIPTGSNIENICNILYRKNIIINRGTFEWLAEKKKYPSNIKPGRYKLRNKMSNNELIDLLRSGKQDPVKLSFNNLRTIYELAGAVGRHLETDSSSILNVLEDDEFLARFGFNHFNVMVMFVPNTYQFYWNINAESFIKRMYKEYEKFWDAQRTLKAKEMGLTNIEVVTLASIVDDETNMNSELPVIASVYLNRLKREMPLQADPTVKFAVGDFTLKRLLKKHTEFISPYNTYINKGLPPGPISMPSIKAIDAVLNYEKTSYLYFCAKADFSGSHVFAKTLTQHNINAEAYQQALNRKKIY